MPKIVEKSDISLLYYISGYFAKNEVSGRYAITKRLFAALLLIITLLPLYAFGRKESRFEEIDAYIEQRDYNNALVLLQEYIIDYPEDFDNAQKRIQKIIDSRVLYSNLADDLITVIINEPTNDQKKLQMIAELEALEKNPSQTSVEFIRQTKVAAQFTYFRSQFEELMEKGSAEISAGDFSEAINTFYSGLYLYQEDFFDQNYPQQYTETVLNQLDIIEQKVAQFDNEYNQLIIAYKNFETALSKGSVNTTVNSFTELKNVFSAFSLSQQAINVSGRELQNLFIQLSSEYPDLTEASFLPFAYRFILGKTDNPTTGIVASYNTQWDIIIPSLKPLMTTFVKKLFTDSLKTLNESEIPLTIQENQTVVSLLSEIQTTLNTALLLSDLYELRETFTGERDKDSELLFKEDITYLNQLHDFYITQLDSIQKTAVEKNSFENLASSIPLKTDSDESSSYGETIYATTLTLVDFINEMNKLKEEAQSIERKASPTWNDEFNSLTLLCDNTIKYINTHISESWITFAQYTQEKASLSSTPLIDEYKKAEELLNVENKADTQTFEIKNYPSESIPLFTSVLQSIDDHITSLQEKSTLIIRASEIDPSYYSQTMQTSNTTIQNLITELSNIKGQTNQYIALANERILLAQRAKNEALLRYNQAQEALDNLDFQSSRENLQKARTKYNESLSFQESLSLREQSDKLLSELGISISQSENEVVVREVRSLKTDAKTAYYQGNFEKAENLLTQAQSRWASTNIEEDIEITNLLSLVGTALSMKTGRVISSSAPLYPEMSQLLSLAKQYFNTGKDLLSKGKRTEGILILNDAKQKIRELQLVYPLNQEASLLTLRIDQVIDPEAFDSLFEQKFIAAQADFKTTDKRQTAYADLLDLYAINPKYAGLASFIYQAEIELGIKIKPPDQKALAESDRLTKEAATAVNSANRNEIELSAALAKLNTALEKNPDNEDAMVLKDRIQTIIGGKASVVLSSESEALYQRAIQELQKGNTLQAASIVTQLLQKKENQNSSKIIDLKEKVDSLL